MFRFVCLVFLVFHSHNTLFAQEKGDHGGGGVVRPEIKGPPGLTAKQKEALVKQGIHGVPHHPQKGPACGLYALAMVMGYHHDISFDKSFAYPKVRPEDGFGRKGDEPMMEKAGGIIRAFDGRTISTQLARMARDYGYQAEAYISPDPVLRALPLAFGTGKTLPPTITMDDLINQIIARQPVLVAIRDFDEATGLPLPDGPIENSHWVVLTGFAYDVDTGARYVIVQHGLSDGPVVWPLDAFEASWDAAYRSTVTVSLPPVR